MSEKTTAVAKVKAEKAGTVPAVASARNREGILAKMTDPLKEVALACDRKYVVANRGQTMTDYSTGAMVVDALDEAKQHEYGSNAAKLLASYIVDIADNVNLLYGLRRFAMTYTEDFVKEHSEKLMGNGERITTGHWIALCSIDAPADRQKTLDAMLSHGLTVNEIKTRLKSGELKPKNIRQGGRKVSLPKSPLSGLEKLRNQMVGMGNFAKMCDKHVFAPIASMKIDDVSDVLMAKLKADKEVAETLRGQLETTVKHLDACIERTEASLAKKAEKAEKAEEAAEEKPAAPKPAAAKKPAAAAKKPAVKKAVVKKAAGKKPSPKKAGRPAPAKAAV